jgi:hypothetical protein
LVLFELLAQILLILRLHASESKGGWRV